MVSMGKEEAQGKAGMTGIWLIAALVLGILILGDLSRRMADARGLERDATVLQTEVAQLEQDNLFLATQIAQLADEAMIEQWARSQARMILPGERLIFPLPSVQSGGAARATPEPLPALPSNWEVWRALIIGE
jgi:cell division protein FtsB